MNNLNKQESLTQFRNELSKNVNPKEIDFGYCIPDCGNCCPKINWMSWLIARQIGNNLGINEDSICSEFSSGEYDGKSCPFIYSYNLCLIRDLEERHPGCGIYECPPYAKIREVDERGYSLSAKLKNIWLEKLGENYDRDKWLALGHYTVKKAHDLVFKKDTPIKELDALLDVNICIAWHAISEKKLEDI